METTVAVMAVEGGYRGAGGVRWPYSPSEMLILGVFFLLSHGDQVWRREARISAFVLFYVNVCCWV